MGDNAGKAVLCDRTSIELMRFKPRSDVEISRNTDRLHGLPHSGIGKGRALDINNKYFGIVLHGRALLL